MLRDTPDNSRKKVGQIEKIMTENVSQDLQSNNCQILTEKYIICLNIAKNTKLIVKQKSKTQSYLLIALVFFGVISGAHLVPVCTSNSLRLYRLTITNPESLGPGGVSD